jgi:hypothetical protein
MPKAGAGLKRGIRAVPTVTAPIAAVTVVCDIRASAEGSEDSVGYDGEGENRLSLCLKTGVH